MQKRIIIFILIFLSVICAGIPVITGKFFSFGYGENGYHEKFDLGYYQVYPSYLFEVKKFFDEDNGNYNIALLPDDKANVYLWGYGGAGDISLQFIYSKGLIFRQYGEGLVPPNSIDALYDQLIIGIYSGNNEFIEKSLRLLNIKYLILRNDFNYFFYGDVDSPEFLSKQLIQSKLFSRERSFGEWVLYRNLNWNSDLLISSRNSSNPSGCNFSFQKLISTVYLININKCELKGIDFKNSYSKGWMLIDSSLRMYAPTNVDGFMAFVFDSLESKKYTLLFLPQLFLVLGLLINLIIFLIILINFVRRRYG